MWCVEMMCVSVLAAKEWPGFVRRSGVLCRSIWDVDCMTEGIRFVDGSFLGGCQRSC